MDNSHAADTITDWFTESPVEVEFHAEGYTIPHEPTSWGGSRGIYVEYRVWVSEVRMFGRTYTDREFLANLLGRDRIEALERDERERLEAIANHGA